MERPGFLAGLQVHTKQLILVLSEIGAPVGQGHGAGDVGPRFKLLQLLAVGERDDVEQPVAPAEDRLAIGNRWRAVDVVARLIDPVGPASRGIQAMQLEVVAARQTPGPLAQLPPMRSGEYLVPRLVFPHQLAGPGLERVEKRVARTHIHLALRHERRGLHPAASLEVPTLLAPAKGQRTNVPVFAPDEDPSLDYGG